MGKAAGFLLILAGVGTAAYVVPALDVQEEPRRTTAAIPPAASMTTASIAPATQPVAPALVAAPRLVHPIDPAREPAAAKVKPPVVVEAAPVKVGTASEPIKIASGTPPRSDQRLALTKEIQRELRRVGCYAGDIDGEWSGDTRQAMKTFNERVNATLPIDQPDYILKTLVTGHPGDACGKTCPAGQTVAANGRCMPAQVIAQSPGKQTKRPANKSAPARDVAAVEPAPRAQAAQKTTEAVVSSWAPTVVAAGPLPSVAAPQPRLEARPSELPGRMAVGVGADVDSPVAAPAPEAGSRIVIKKREGVAAVAPAPVAPVAPIPADVAADPATSRQKTAAVTPAEPAAEAEDAAAVAAPSRPAIRRQGQPGVYRVPSPAPRYVGVYVAPPRLYSGYNTYRGRTAFGPSIFKRLERDAR